MRLSKPQQKAHAAAMVLVNENRPLTLEERDQVLADFREDAQHLNGVAGAFFTPEGLARDFALHVSGGARVLDLCAGIGRLSDAVGFQGERFCGSDGAASIVCVEQNADYVKVGRAVLPRAMWVCADVFDLGAYAHLGPFDVVIANPPFGRIKTGAAFSGKYKGNLFEFKLIELATRLAPYGVFIVPQSSAPFQYSGRREFSWTPDGAAENFRKTAGITLRPNIGVDTAIYREEWNGPSILTEIVIYDPTET